MPAVGCPSLAGVTTWSHPLEDHFRSLFLQMKGDKCRAAKGKAAAGETGGRAGGHPFASTHHQLDDAETADDGASDDGSSLGRSAASVRGRDQQWELSAGQTSGPFIRSYGTSTDLGASLAAARAKQPPPPLPNMSRDADLSSAPMGGGKKARGARGSLLSASTADGLALPPIAGPSGGKKNGGWMPPAGK